MKKKSHPQPEMPLDPSQAAKAAGLKYVNDQIPGIQRIQTGKSFKYKDAEGKIIRDTAILKRIKALAIPPAYTDVWICPIENGHLQATGRDAKGRKQYRYHAHWRETRDETKYTKMIAFGRVLPKIRKQVNHDLSLTGMKKEKILAAVVKLLETTLIRIGNEEYARENNSFGLTTLQNQHVDISGEKIIFKFRGKSKQKHHITLNSPRLAKVVRRCKHIPGQELFQYLDDQGEPASISSTDVNEYLQEITQDAFTAKDFRTWAGTVLAAFALQEFEKFDSDSQAKRNIVQAVEKVAKRLGNTPSICRKCYIHPEILNAYLDGSLLTTIKQRTEQELIDSLTTLSPEEAAVLAFLEKRLTVELNSRK